MFVEKKNDVVKNNDFVAIVKIRENLDWEALQRVSNQESFEISKCKRYFENISSNLGTSIGIEGDLLLKELCIRIEEKISKSGVYPGRIILLGVNSESSPITIYPIIFSGEIAISSTYKKRTEQYYEVLFLQSLLKSDASIVEIAESRELDRIKSRFVNFTKKESNAEVKLFTMEDLIKDFRSDRFGEINRELVKAFHQGDNHNSYIVRRLLSDSSLVFLKAVLPEIWASYHQGLGIEFKNDIDLTKLLRISKETLFNWSKTNRSIDTIFKIAPPILAKAGRDLDELALVEIEKYFKGKNENIRNTHFYFAYNFENFSGIKSGSIRISQFVNY